MFIASQYLVPLLLVLLIYGLIYKNVQENQYPRHLRQTKTNTLLGEFKSINSHVHPLVIKHRIQIITKIIDFLYIISASISLTHCLIWLPFSLFNIIVEQDSNFFGENTTYYQITVQLFGLASACTNPVLYAFFNENFQREFKDGIEWTKSRFCRGCISLQPTDQPSQNSTIRAYNNQHRRNTDQVEMVYLKLNVNFCLSTKNVHSSKT